MSAKILLRLIPVCLFAFGMGDLMAAPPANDSFAGAVQMTGTFDTKSGTTQEATRQAGERTETGTSTTWFKWTAPADGRARFSILPTDSTFENSRLSIWYGASFETLVYLGAHDSSSAQSLIQNVPVRSGSTYYICVGKNNTSTNYRGPFTCSVVLNVSSDLNTKNVVAVSSSNWAFANATTLAGTDSTAISYGRDAVLKEAGEPAINPNYSSWWKWVAPSDGSMRVSLFGSEIDDFYDYYADKRLLIYKVNSFQEMITASPVGGYSVSYGLPPDLTIPVKTGETFYITAGVSGSNPGDFRFKILTLQLLPNVTASPAASSSYRIAVSREIRKTKKAIKSAKKKGLKSKVKKLKKKLSRLKRLR